MRKVSKNRYYKVEVNCEELPFRIKAKNWKDAAEKGQAWWEKADLSGYAVCSVRVYNDEHEVWAVAFEADGWY